FCFSLPTTSRPPLPTLFPYTTLFRSHPLFPLKQTIADINLEQVGRSDSDIGKGNASTNGYGYTTITPIFEKAASVSGLSMVRTRSEEHTSELQSQSNIVCRLLLEKKK